MLWAINIRVYLVAQQLLVSSKIGWVKPGVWSVSQRCMSFFSKLLFTVSLAYAIVSIIAISPFVGHVTATRNVVRQPEVMFGSSSKYSPVAASDEEKDQPQIQQQSASARCIDIFWKSYNILIHFIIFLLIIVVGVLSSRNSSFGHQNFLLASELRTSLFRHV